MRDVLKIARGMKVGGRRLWTHACAGLRRKGVKGWEEIQCPVLLVLVVQNISHTVGALFDGSVKIHPYAYKLYQVCWLRETTRTTSGF